MPKNPRKDNPDAIQGAGHKDEKGNYHGKHHSMKLIASQNTGYEGKHQKDADIVDIKTGKKKTK